MIEERSLGDTIRAQLDKVLEFKVATPLRIVVEKVEGAIATYRDRRFNRLVALKGLYGFYSE
jgi:hypothetical protein